MQHIYIIQKKIKCTLERDGKRQQDRQKFRERTQNSEREKEGGKEKWMKGRNFRERERARGGGGGLERNG